MSLDVVELKISSKTIEQFRNYINQEVVDYINKTWKKKEQVT